MGPSHGVQASPYVRDPDWSNGFEYTILSPFPLWAGMDGENPMTRGLGAAGAQALQAKLRRCILQQSSYMVTRNDSLSIPAAGDATVWRTTVRRYLPGKRGEYETLVKAELLPALRKAKEMGRIAGYIHAARGAGSAANEFSETEVFMKFADLDGGNYLGQAMGGIPAATAFNAKRTALSTTVQTVIRRRVADLSF